MVGTSGRDGDRFPSVGLAPEVFQLGNDNVSVVIDPEGTDDDLILDAARACPVDAITLIDEFEDQVWPR
jgi:ferredoxin